MDSGVWGVRWLPGQACYACLLMSHAVLWLRAVQIEIFSFIEATKRLITASFSLFVSCAAAAVTVLLARVTTRMPKATRAQKAASLLPEVS
jgi:hypothetical protein